MRKIITIMFALILIMCTKVFASDSSSQEYHSTISVDYGSVYAVRNDGVLYKFDINDDEIIKTEITDRVTDVSRNYALKEDGTLWTWDSETCIPVQVMESVKAISACGAVINEILIQKEDDSLWCIKKNLGGQLFKGIMDEEVSKSPSLNNRYYSTPVKIMDNVKKAAKGAYHSLVLKNDGSVWAWGDNVYGECGAGEDWFPVDNPNKVMTGVSDIFASGAVSFAVKKNTTELYKWGSNYIDYLTLKPERNVIPTKYAEDVKDIINIPGYNLLVKKDNSLWVYGDTGENQEIEVGIKNINVPVKLYDDIDSVSGMDNCFDDRFCDLTAMLNTNGRLFLLESIYKKTDNTIFKTREIAYNIRLSDAQIKKVEFADLIDLDEEKRTAVTRLAESDIIQGVTDTAFMPDKTITRAETAALLLRIIEKENEATEPDFSDVPKDSWYYNVAGASQKYRIINGYNDHTFCGEESVSDVQLVVMAARTLRREGLSELPEIETARSVLYGIPEWAREDIEYALKYGLITEEEAKKLSDEGMTRGEAAVILYRAYCLI